MRFYVLKSPIQPEETNALTKIMPPDGLIRTGEAPRCPICGGIIGMLPTEPPLIGEVELDGQFFGDIAYGPGGDIYFSERLKNEFISRRLVGIDEFGPINIIKVTSRGIVSNKLPDYFLARPAVSRAFIDDVKSGVMRRSKSNCPECLGGDPKKIERLILAKDSWSGEDIFKARGLFSEEIASERFRLMCSEMNFMNFIFVRAEDFHFDYTKPDWWRHSS